MKATKYQQQAIDSNSDNILVSAGAGSGKTAVLVSRIMRKIEDLENPVNIDELLVVTFTNAAAAEMKERIYSRLKETIEKLDNDKETKLYMHLKNQLDIIDGADITTFDAYLINFMKKYGYLIGVNKNVAVGDEVQMQLWLEEVIHNEVAKLIELINVSDEEITKAGYNADVSNLIKGEDIKSFINNYYIFQEDQFEKSLKTAYSKYEDIYNVEKFNDEVFTNTIVEDYLKVINIVDEKLIKLTDLRNQFANVLTDDKGSKYIEEYLEVLDEQLRITNKEDKVSSLKPKAMSRAKFENKDNLKIINEQIKKEIEELQKLLPFLNEKKTIEIETSKLKDKYIIYGLILNISKSYQEVKHKYNSYTFTDIIKMSLKILENKDIQKQVQSQYNEIMVDEYQDTNDFQNALMQKISNKNLYLVGDVKQSIYGFRNANPENFNELQVQYNENKNDEVINLMDNFRSREEVLDDINVVFEEIMTKELANINYSDNHALDYGNKSFDTKVNEQNYNMEVWNYSLKEFLEFHEIDKDNKDYLEAIMIAKDIKKKVAEKHQVLKYSKEHDDNILVDIDYSDFAILTRRKSKYPFYEKVFEELGIPLQTQLEKNFYNVENFEISLLINIVNYLLNNDKMLSLVGILRSFLFDINEQQIYDFIEIYKENKNIDELAESGDVNEDIISILNKLNKIEKVKNNSLNYLLNYIFQQFDFINKTAHLKSQINLIERLTKLQSLTKQFDNSGMNLEQFLDYLNKLSTDNDLKISLEVEENTANSVQLMTIHKSKGLEFPIVYLADNKKEIYKASKDAIIVDDTYDFVFDKIENNLKYKTMYKPLLNQKEEKKELEEAIRVLYVAMTRAKEQLIFLVNNDEKTEDDSFKKFLHLITNLDEKLNSYQVPLYVENFDKEYLQALLDNINSGDSNKYKSLPKESDIKYTYKEINIPLKERTYHRASKNISEVIDIKSKENMKLGNEIHSYLELIDFKDIKNSQNKVNEDKYISSNNKEILNKFIEIIKQEPKLQNIENFWTEYEFIYEDKEEKVNGIIDLLVETKDEFLIIDYKLSDIDDPKYKEQLNTYKKYLETINNDKEIKMYLYSILKGELREIN